MASAPFQPIPEATQVHQDRLIGAQLGELQVGARVSEGRFGTIYQATHRGSGKQATLEVLRSELVGDDEEVKAGKAIKCAGIADVSAFGELPDGRRYRVMEFLDGESLDQLLLRRGRLSPLEVVQCLGQIAEVLQAAHSWAVPHGSLGPSSVFLVGRAVKLIDFGLSKGPVSLEADLQQLGALGFTLLTGEDGAGRVPLPPGIGIPEPLDRLLRELLENRIKDVTAARGALARVSLQLDAPPPPPSPAPAPRRGRALIVAALSIALVGGGALWRWPRAETPPVVLEDEELEDAAELETEEAATPQPSEPMQTSPQPPSPAGPRRVRPVPSAAALMEEISRLESRFRRLTRPGDDIDQALFVLNRQRLRLTGSPSELDRKDVARQLAGWRRSYLRR